MSDHVTHRIPRNLLREIRIQAGLRQKDLAGRLHVPQSFVSKYESGERRLDVLEIRKICRACGWSLTAFTQELETRIEREDGCEPT